MIEKGGPSLWAYALERQQASLSGWQAALCSPEDREAGAHPSADLPWTSLLLRLVGWYSAKVPQGLLRPAPRLLPWIPLPLHFVCAPPHFYQVDTKSGEIEKTKSIQTNTKTSSELFLGEIIKVNNTMLPI